MHTPEFDFERDLANVRQAATEMKINYPVALDNDYKVWQAFGNQYWPALYFVDAEGHIRHQVFGEGEYESSERVIQQLLGEAGDVGFEAGTGNVESDGAELQADWRDIRSDENYLGLERTRKFSSPEAAALETRRTYHIPDGMTLNH